MSIRLIYRITLKIIIYEYNHFIIHSQLSMASHIHEQMALVPKSPIPHLQTISPFPGTDKLGRVTILARERALVGLKVIHTDTIGE